MKHKSNDYEHFKDRSDLDHARDKLDGPLKILLFDLKEKPMSREELLKLLTSFMPHAYHKRRTKYEERALGHLDQSLKQGFDLNLIEENESLISLTGRGKELAAHMETIIPWFFEKVFSIRTVTVTNMIVHVVLSVIKLGAAICSGSAGLLADGIDNGGDTLSSILVWLGIKHKKERLTSIFIVGMMYVSAGGVVWATVNKILNPQPISGGWIVFSISAVAGLVMLLMSLYEYGVGKRKRSFALMCQSVDALNHFWTSLVVCLGIVLSYLANVLSAPWLLYADALASTIIGVLIVKSAIELTVELAKPAGEESTSSHYLERIRFREGERFIRRWIEDQLAAGPLSQTELEKRYRKQFCRKPPRFAALTGWEDINFRPENLEPYLIRFVEKGVIVKVSCNYKLP